VITVFIPTLYIGFHQSCTYIQRAGTVTGIFVFIFVAFEDAVTKTYIRVICWQRGEEEAGDGRSTVQASASCFYLFQKKKKKKKKERSTSTDVTHAIPTEQVFLKEVLN
jgi:hypothetical protein